MKIVNGNREEHNLHYYGLYGQEEVDILNRHVGVKRDALEDAVEIAKIVTAHKRQYRAEDLAIQAFYASGREESEFEVRMGGICYLIKVNDDDTAPYCKFKRAYLGVTI